MSEERLKTIAANGCVVGDEAKQMARELLSLRWTPITESNLPRVEDEALSASGNVRRVTADDVKGADCRLWRDNFWIYRRPLNSPPQDKEGADGK